jgi:hypothetical protein
LSFGTEGGREEHRRRVRCRWDGPRRARTEHSRRARVSLLRSARLSPLSVYAWRNSPNLQSEQKAWRIKSGHRFGRKGFTLVPVAVSHRPNPHGRAPARRATNPQGDESAGRRAAAFPSLLPPVHAGPESAPRHAFGCEPTRRADGRNECTFLADGRAVPVHDASPGHSPDSDRSH